MATSTLPDRLRHLEQGAPRLFSRWSAKSWRLVCEGPAVKLWDALGDQPGAESALADYLFLLREAVGLQYISASAPEDLTGGADARGFLAVALCDVVPRLLPKLAEAHRSKTLTQIWNVGERLAAQPVWLNRYLAARLADLATLDDLEPFLERALHEGLDPVKRSTWKGPFSVTVVDPSRHDRAFLPGPMHLATPSIVCVHDQRRFERQVAILLRAGKSFCLGATPHLVPGDAPEHARLSGKLDGELFLLTGLGERSFGLATHGGFALFVSPLSQRVWIVESA